jgi:hypothetical protein
MERQQHERQSKHHEVAGAFGSRWATAAPSKSLAKRPRHTPQDDSPSPPRDARPPTSDEYEALKMRSPKVHTNCEIINYNKINPNNIVTLREISCYNNFKERGTDERFWTFFQQDWYGIVLFTKNKPVVLVQWVHFDYMRNNKDATFNRILEACEFHGIANLMQFWYNWNKEVISEFYATLYFDKKERIFMWMTAGQRFSTNLSQFVEILGLASHNNNPKKIHTRRVMMTREMVSMYVPDSGFDAPKIDGLLLHFVVLHRMRRKTLAPRIGDSNAIPAYEQNLLDVIMKNEHFNVFDYIVNEIWNITINPLRSCGFAPFIMCMIESVAH